MATPSVAVNGHKETLHTAGSSAVEKRSHEEDITDEVRFSRSVDEFISKVDELEQKVNAVSEFYANKRLGDIITDLKEKENEKEKETEKEKVKEKEKDKENENENEKEKESDKEKQGTNSNNNNNANGNGNTSGAKKPMDGPRSHMACSKRMQELMRQFGTILRQEILTGKQLSRFKHQWLEISQHKWAWPFMEPVDVKGLGLHDYHEVIKKPMDLSTIRNQMEAKNDTGYKNVSDIYADARLVFTNAMTYNDERNDIHIMARTLLAKLEEKWLLLWPKVVEEEKRQKVVETHVVAMKQFAHEVAMAKMAADADNELNEIDSQLDELREMVVKKSRKWSTEEKRKLGAGLSALSTEDLNMALEIIAQNNPRFQTFGEVVEFDMDAQSETTLWRLKFFVKEALEHHSKNSARKDADNLKRTKEICDALAKTARKRNRRLASS